IATRCFEILLRQSHHYYQNQFSGSLANKINDLTSSIPDMIQIITDRFLSNFLAIAIAILTLWQVDSIFALSVLSWTTLFVGGSLFLSKKLSHLSDIWSEWGSTLTGKMVDVFSNILSVRLFSRSAQEKKGLQQTFQKAIKAEQKLQWHYFWIWIFYGYSFVIIQGINLYFLIKGRHEGWITIGDFALVLTINIAIVEFLWQLTREFSQFSKLFGRIAQALRTILVIPELQDKPQAKLLVVEKGQIVFEKVQFHYRGAEALFQNKSVTITPGQKVGLVGYSGSGKSTFVNLILRLFDVTVGCIMIDGQDIRDVTQDSLRANIGMIPQDPSLFHRTLMENIRYGKWEASEEDVIEASKKAHAHAFISHLNEGYDSLVGERGVKISGGQRQRIAIARAILKNAPLLILDEATSQLDSITENYIQDSLWDLMQGKTTLVVAHRLSTLLHMDRILVFDKGKIVEDGTHEDLLLQDGLYKTLWTAQVGGFLPKR
ncbi:MAG: ABC transporter ATP-binding protein/permease, partial [Alphaproteobacteria bacterium]|nr:ABC transporter ATP-binding protein/permease [Alphaproteobacteria bacterium]